MNEEDLCRRTTRGVALGTRVPTDVYQSGPDYKPAITDRPRTAGRSAEKQGPKRWSE